MQDTVKDADAIPMEIQRIQTFLSNPQYPKGLLFHTLQNEVQKIIGYDQVLLDLLKFCTRCITDQLYLLTDESFKYTRVIAHLLVLLDASNDKKKFKLDTVRVALVMGLWRQILRYVDVQNFEKVSSSPCVCRHER